MKEVIALQVKRGILIFLASHQKGLGVARGMRKRLFPLVVLILVQQCLFAQKKKQSNDGWFSKMDVGPAWMNTFADYYGNAKRTAVLKGISLDLGEGWRGLFDTETLQLVRVSQETIEWGATPWTGAHGTLITMGNKTPLQITAKGSGWADADGSFEDKRSIKGFGNMPHAVYTGYYRHGREVVLEYTVNGSTVLDHFTRESAIVTRSLKISAHDKPLTLSVADATGDFQIAADGKSAKSADGLEVIASAGVKWVVEPANSKRLLAQIPAAKTEATVQIAFARGAVPTLAKAPDFKKLTSGGPGIWQEVITTAGVVSDKKDSSYVTDVLTLPENNPWGANLRFGGFDFIDEDSAALSSWNGDVWIVKGLKGDWKELKWQRIASGLFEPLGLKVVKGEIYVNGRDQITKLIDLNKDGEIDYYKTFNRDVYISQNFHEFAFELQTDKEGNFYFSKGGPVRSGGRNFEQILPHHGIVAKISPDGKKFEVVATGLRAPGGLSVGPEGQITTGENEGTWQPCCKINYVAAKNAPAFFGTEPTRQSLANAAYTAPLVYLPMDVDNSGGSQLWVPDFAKFGLKTGELIHLSYGKSSVYRVLPVEKDGKMQGGVVKLPITLQSSAMRARFHQDGSMYVLGFRGWQTNAPTHCAFQRVRYNPEVGINLPEKLEYTDTGVKIHFSTKLDAELANDKTSYSGERWDYVRGPQYGSGEFSVDTPDQVALEKALASESKNHKMRDKITISSAKLSADGKAVELVIDGMKPSMSLKVAYDLENADGDVMIGDIHATVYGK